MNRILKLFAGLGLGLTVLPALFFYFEAIDLRATKLLMAAGMVTWLISALMLQNLRLEQDRS